MKIFKRQYIITCIAVLSFFGMMMSGCEADSEQKLEERTWQLAWSDDFDGDAGQLVDDTKWTYDIGTGQNGWGNQELQYYTDAPENVSLDGEGNLVISALRETFGGSPFTSARIKTQGLFSQKHGRFEARIKTPYGPGLWPAFWLLSADIDEVGWPQCGEIDIMELRGQQPNIINGSLHGPGYSGGNPISRGFGLSDSRFDSEFHIFAVEWDEGFIEFFVDEVLYQRITPEDLPEGEDWVFNDSEFFIILNVAVGGNYVGFPISVTPFPQKMIVDYVKVYQ